MIYLILCGSVLVVAVLWLYVDSLIVCGSSCLWKLSYLDISLILVFFCFCFSQIVIFRSDIVAWLCIYLTVTQRFRFLV